MAEHHLEVAEAAQWAARAADVFDFAIRGAVDLKGSCVLALSGGVTPGPVFTELAARDLPWASVVITQADERLAPDGDSVRNLTGQKTAFSGLPVQWLPLPAVDPTEADLDRYLEDLASVAGPGRQLDLVHLGIGTDGHVASLIPGDPAVAVTDRDIALTDTYLGTKRVTLTRPILDRASLVVFLVQGAVKAPIVARLVYGDTTVPAGMLKPNQSIVLADPAAAAAAR